MFELPPTAPAAALHRLLDPFLRGAGPVDARSMNAFTALAARHLRLAGPPRRAALLLPAHGIRISRQPLPAGVWAVWSVEDGAYHIRISPFLSETRGNFTLWHEVFEIMATRPAFPNPPGKGTAEPLANRFAACITMPEPDVVTAVQMLGDRPDKCDVLAARFAVSVPAMRRRIRELGLARYSRG